MTRVPGLFTLRVVYLTTDALPSDTGEIVAAIDGRLAQFGDEALRNAIGGPLAGQTLAARVREAIRVYKEFLAAKHGGKHIRAARSNRMMDRWGEKEAMRRTVTDLKMSNGLELLAKYGRLDCAYERTS
jgi:hypothetical protein